MSSPSNSGRQAWIFGVRHLSQVRSGSTRLHIFVEPHSLHTERLSNLTCQWWPRSVAPSDALLHWFGFDPEKWSEFRRRYRRELECRREECLKIRDEIHLRSAELVYATGDGQHNVAVALGLYLDQLECERRYDAGWILGGYMTPVRHEIVRLGGLWYGRHKAWVMPDRASWRTIQSILPGDF